MPKVGSLAPKIGAPYILGTLGPMSTSLEGIKIMMRTVIDAKPWLEEPSLVPLPWRETGAILENKATKPLKIGIMWSDGVVKPHSSITRAISTLKQCLDAMKEVETVEWKPYKHDLAWEIIVNVPPNHSLAGVLLIVVQVESLLRRRGKGYHRAHRIDERAFPSAIGIYHHPQPLRSKT